MLSVAESAELLGVSGARVRALISSGNLPAQKAGRAWVLKEEDVMARVAKRPGPGRRPSSKDGESAARLVAGDSASSNWHELYLACKDAFCCCPSSGAMKEARSSEEASFYMAVADFFLQQKQRELIEHGVY